MVFGRDNFTCQKCNIRGKYLNAHHIKPFSILIHINNINTYDDVMNCDDLWKISNGITYCQKCHLEEDKMIGKKNIIEIYNKGGD